jgi:predicted nuclease of predicted toxin-antitoxin system
MRILADENLESEIVEALRKAGHTVSDIKEMTPGVDDPDVLALANEESAILVTNDKDFGELIYKKRLFSNGVILLRFGKLEIEERIEFLIDVLREHDEELLHAFTVITPTGVRIRK